MNPRVGEGRPIGRWKGFVFRLIPCGVAVAAVLSVWAWQRVHNDPLKRGQELNQRAWESSYTERGLPVPPGGPREGYWGKLLGKKAYDPKLGWREPSVVIPGRVEIDADGLQHFKSSVPTKRQVLVLGGSVGFGAYSSSIPTTYFHVLGTALEQAGTPADVTVIAAGSWNSFQDELALRLYGERFRPDLVVFLDGLNDLTTSPTTSYEKRVNGYLDNMKKAAETCSRLDCAMLVVLQPSLAERARRTPIEEVLLANSLQQGNHSAEKFNSSFEAMRQGLTALARPPAVQFLDCSRLFDGESATTFSDLWHFSDRGHELLGRALAAKAGSILADRPVRPSLGR